MLLYIEDNHDIAENVIAYLKTEWYSVDWYDRGDTWLEAALSKRYDLIVLDVMLPGKDGFTFCRELRKSKQLPIIMTTAKWELDDKAEWFDGGVDDYLVKPFELAELVMRIQALLKRSEISDHLTIWEIDIYIDEKRCTRSGQDVHLTLKERQILLELVDANWLPVARTDIIDAVWWADAIYEDDSKLDVYIANIRKKLSKSLIETVKGFGYKIAK